MGELRMNLPRKALAALLALMTLLTLWVPLSARAAESSKTVSVTVRQTVTGSPKTPDAFAYTLKPKDGAPLSGKGAFETLTLTGAEEKTFSLTFSEPGNYEYQVGRVLNRNPLTFDDKAEVYDFGFMVRRAEDGTLTVTPYTCVNDELKLLEGGVICSYELKYALPTTTTTTTAPTSTRTAVTTTKRGSWVNTGDPAQTLLWVTLASISALALLVIFFWKRRKDEDER